MGNYQDAAGGHGFVLDQGRYTTLDVPGSSFTIANGISPSGHIVGYYYEGGLHGFLAIPVPVPAIAGIGEYRWRSESL